MTAWMEHGDIHMNCDLCTVRISTLVVKGLRQEAVLASDWAGMADNGCRAPPPPAILLDVYSVL